MVFRSRVPKELFLSIGIPTMFYLLRNGRQGNFFGPRYRWAMKMGQWSMSHSFACKNQDFDVPFEILMDYLEKRDGPKKP